MNLPAPTGILGTVTLGVVSALLCQVAPIPSGDLSLSTASNLVGTAGLVTVLVIIVRYLLKMYELKDAKLTDVLTNLVVKQQEQNALLLSTMQRVAEELRLAREAAQNDRGGN